jgi:phosphatidylglycerophosphatase A
MAWYVLKFHGPLELAVLGGALFLIGCWSAGVYARRTNDDDPSSIVIDEVAAQCLVLTAVPATPAYFVVAFAAFRFTDIVKPWPASWADRSVKGGFGIMLDDILAGLYAWALMYGIVFVLN